MIAKLAGTHNTCSTENHFISSTIWAYWRRLLRKNENEAQNNHFFLLVPLRHQSSRCFFLSLYTWKPVMVVNSALKAHATAVSLRSCMISFLLILKWYQAKQDTSNCTLVLRKRILYWKKQCWKESGVWSQLHAKIIQQELRKTLKGHHKDLPCKVIIKRCVLTFLDEHHQEEKLAGAFVASSDFALGGEDKQLSAAAQICSAAPKRQAERQLQWNHIDHQYQVRLSLSAHPGCDPVREGMLSGMVEVTAGHVNVTKHRCPSMADLSVKPPVKN